MVSMNPSSPEGFYLDAKGATLPGINPFHPATATATATATSSTPVPENSPTDDPNSKKVRKPYTITKSRESWTEPEHDKFLEALQLFDRDWKKIEAFVGSKTVIQIRSHAQKYFLKAQKSGSNEHLPPPRPKRKAAHPYPQKAPKNATPDSQPVATFQPSSTMLEPPAHRDSASVPRHPNNNRGDMRSTGPPTANNCSSSAESTPMAHIGGETNEQINQLPPLRVLPDFAQVYKFIGSVFDPEASDHFRRLKKMAPIDVETVMLLMRNLSINLTSSDFEDHRQLLSSYEIDLDKSR